MSQHRQHPASAAGDSAAGHLSERELDVVRAVAQGLSNAEIAAKLYLSEAMVKSHVARVLAKLDLRDRVQIAVFAYENGIVRPGHMGRPLRHCLARLIAHLPWRA
jgi:DNA-binding NarL/FixJ family response regulator